MKCPPNHSHFRRHGPDRRSRACARAVDQSLGPSSLALTELAVQFESVPMVIGDWNGTPFDFSPDDRAKAGAVACLGRLYSNPNRGVSVSLLMLGGLPGNISTHGPDICYPGAGYLLNTPSHFHSPLWTR